MYSLLNEGGPHVREMMHVSEHDILSPTMDRWRPTNHEFFMLLLFFFMDFV